MAFMVGFSEIFYADGRTPLPLINTDDTDRNRLPEMPKLPKTAEIETFA